MKMIALLVVSVAMAAMASAQVKDLGSGREVLWDMDRIAALGGHRPPPLFAP